MARRTKAGSITAETRKQFGSKGGKFPVFDHRSALSAIRLRHHGKGITAKAVLDKVARWAKRVGDKAVLAKVAEARERDKRR